MANGLRKLIRKARRFSTPSITTRRVHTFGTRLKVEELEERIAPAAVTLNPGDFTTYDVAGGANGDGAHDATDGVFGVGDGAAASDNDLVCTITDVDVTILDDTTPVITDIDFGALTATETVVIATNRTIGDLNLGNLTTAFDTTTITTLNLVLIAGNAAADGAAANELMFDDVAGASDFDYSFDTYTAGTGDDPTDAEVFSALGTAGIGTITLPTSVHTSGLTVNLVCIAGATGTITSITSTATDVTLASAAATNADGSVINAGAITTLNWAGPVQPGAVDIWVDADSNAGAGIGTLTLGAVTAAAAGDVIIDSDGGIETLTTGAVTLSSTGDFKLDADDDGGGDDGVTGAATFGAIAVSAAGAQFTVDAGGSGFASTLTTGAITVSSAADNASAVNITTSNNGDYTGAVTIGAITNSASGGGDITLTTAGTGGFASTLTTGAITNSATGASSVTISTAGAGDFTGLVTTGAITASGTASAPITIQPGASGALAGGITTGLITASGTNAGADITIGNTTGATGNVTLAGITNSSGVDADVTIQGLSIGNISSSAAIQTAAAAVGDIVINAAGATNTGSIGNISVTAGGIVANQAGATVTIQANDDIGSVSVTGNLGGAGAVSVTADNGGTADTGNIGNISVSGGIGNGAGAVTISAVDIGTIDAASIGAGAGGVTITADGADATDGAGGGVIGNIGSANTLVSIGLGAAVTLSADDGIGTISTTGSVAFGGNVTLNANVDAQDDTGSVGAITAGTTIGVSGGNELRINTNDGGVATDNTTERTIGAVTASGGFARLDIDTDGDVGLVTVTGGGASGNDLEIEIDADGTADPSNAIDLAGINVADTANNDSVTITAATEITGRLDPTGANGGIIAGGGDATDQLVLNANVSIYNGDDEADGFDADYISTLASKVEITTGAITGAGEIFANTLNASPLFTAVINSETYQVDASTAGVSALIDFDPAGGSGGSHQVAVDDISGLTAATELIISTSGSSEFDVNSITLATTADGENASLIRIEGDLQGDIGQASPKFGTVETILIEGDAGASAYTFYGTGISGLGTGSGTLVMGPDVVINVLDRETSEPLTINGGINFQFADTAGAAASSLNHNISVVGAGTSAVVYGIDGSGDSTADAEYLFSGTGVSTAQTGATNDIDPNDLISGAAVIGRINLVGVTGLSTDVSVREVDGTTSGSWLEFNTDVGLVNLTTQLDSISVGIDDNADLVDNVVVTGVTHQGNTSDNIDRLGGGEAGGAKSGLQPATSISDSTAALGNFVAQSMGDPGATNINIVVTGSSGPITLTGDLMEDSTPDHGDLDSDTGAGGAAIAIGDNAEGAITIPGDVDGDILIGIGLDDNGDGDVVDSGEEPGGNLNGNVTIGDMGGVDILVAGNITSDIVITGADQDLEDSGMELDGDLRGVKATGNIGVLGEDVLVVACQVDDIIADGALNSGIFVGGDEGSVDIEATGINGPAVLGATGGIDNLEVVDHEVFGDVGDHDEIDVDYAMVVQWVAGGFNDTLDVLGDVYMFNDDNDDLTISTDTGDSMNVGDIFQLENDNFDVFSPADIGVIVVADGATIPTSEALQDLITTAYDVVRTPTTLDTNSGNDDTLLNFSGSIYAANADGLVVQGNVNSLTAIVSGNFGDIIALDGDIDSTAIHAGLSIGSIVASMDIDGDFISEGTLAVGTVLDVTTYGLSGVPSWFTGGVLTEAGDIQSGCEFTAVGPTVLTAPGIPVSNGDAMGTVYVLTGDIDGNYDVFGNMGGIVAAVGTEGINALNVSGTIDVLVIPNAGNSITGYTGTGTPRAAIEAINGETVVSASGGYASGNVAVSATGGLVAIVDNNDSDATSVDLITAIGLGTGTSLSVTGDVNTLSVEGNWDGTVNVSGSDLDETDGEVGTINVDGNIEDDAVLNAANFQELLVSGTIDPAVTDSGTIDSSDPSDPVMLGATQEATLYVRGSSNITADWEAIFGKVTSLAITGRGKTDVVLVDGSATDAELADIAKDGDVDDGSANLGSLSADMTVKLDDVVVQGSVDAIAANRINDMFIAGDAGDVIANKIGAADIGGNIDMLTAKVARNVMVDGDADQINAYSLKNVTILGHTDELIMTGTWGGGAKGKIVNSIFGEGVDWMNFDLDGRYNHVRIRNTAGLWGD